MTLMQFERVDTMRIDLAGCVIYVVTYLIYKSFSASMSNFKTNVGQPCGCVEISG